MNQVYFRRQILALVRRAADCRHHPAGHPTLVCFTSGDAGRRGTFRTHPVGNPEGSRTHGLSPAGVESLPGDPALPPERARTVSLGGGNSSGCGKALGTSERAAIAGRRRAPPSVHGMPEKRDPDASLVRLPWRSLVPSRQQDRTEDRVVIPAPHGMSSRTSTGRGAGSSRGNGPGSQRARPGCGSSGIGFVPKRICSMYAFTISAIPLRVLPFSRARAFSSSAGCSGTTIHRLPSSTRTWPMQWCARRSRP